MEKITKYRILKNIYVEGLGEFRKGAIAMLNRDELNMFPDYAIEHEGDYVQGFRDDAKPIDCEFDNEPEDSD